jgi:hypothetical protein
MTPGGKTGKKKKASSAYYASGEKYKAGVKSEMLPEEEDEDDEDEIRDDDDEVEPLDDADEDEDEMNEAKMKDSEVLAAAKKLAKNGKDKKTKDFGKGLVDFHKKNNSFTPDQVSGLQNIMKNASFQMAKEESSVLNKLQDRLSEMNEEELQELSNLINDPIESSVASVSRRVDTLVKANTASESSTEDVNEEAENTPEALDQLIESDESLSEDFKAKAATLFEAAVSEKLEKEVEAIREEYENQIHEQVEKNYQEMASKIGGYLGHAIESWMEVNDESITNKLRTQISESFIESLKDVFEKHYIDMPEGKVDIYEDISNKAAELEETAEEQAEQIESLNETVIQLQKEKIIREAREDMYATEADRFQKLVKNLEFETEENFKEKVNLIKETYFGKYNDNGLSEENEDENERENLSEYKEVHTHTLEDEDEPEIDLNSDMGRYIQALSNQVK